jgi:hypothetical protein
VFKLLVLKCLICVYQDDHVLEESSLIGWELGQKLKYCSFQRKRNDTYLLTKKKKKKKREMILIQCLVILLLARC